MNKLWLVTDGEDTYWVAAPDMQLAEDAVLKHLVSRYGDGEFILKSSIDPHPSKRWVLSRHAEPVILASTEMP